MIEGMWLGVTVASQREHPGGRVLVRQKLSVSLEATIVNFEVSKTHKTMQAVTPYLVVLSVLWGLKITV